jgi:hypothetical protein
LNEALMVADDLNSRLSSQAVPLQWLGFHSKSQV